MRKAQTKEEQEELGVYADCADELCDYGPGSRPLKMSDLSPQFVANAERTAMKFGLNWPPTQAWEDEVRDAGFYDRLKEPEPMEEEKDDRPAFALGVWQLNGKARKVQQSELLPIDKKKGVRQAFNPNRRMSFVVVAVITRGRNLVPMYDWCEIPPRASMEFMFKPDHAGTSSFIGSEIRSDRAAV